MSEQNPHQQASRHDAERAARRHSLALDVFYADNLAAQQSQDVIRFLYANAGAQACVICMPVSDIDAGAGPVAEHPLHKLAHRVAAKGAGWIVLNRDAEAQVMALRREFAALPLAVVTPDQKEFGRIQGRQFRALLPQGGRALYVLGNPLASSSRDRRAGMLELVEGAGISVEEVDGMWAADRARMAVGRWLAGACRREHWPDLVGCQNDEMALGAREALREAAAVFKKPWLAEVPVTGGDGLPEGGQRWVAERKLAATVVLPTTTGIAIDMLADFWKSGRALPLKTVVPVSAHPAIDRLAPVRSARS